MNHYNTSINKITQNLDHWHIFLADCTALPCWYLYCIMQVHILNLAISRRLAKCVRGAGPEPNAKFRIRRSVLLFHYTIFFSFSGSANADDSGYSGTYTRQSSARENFTWRWSFPDFPSFSHPCCVEVMTNIAWNGQVKTAASQKQKHKHRHTKAKRKRGQTMSWSFWLECPLRFVSLVFVTLNMKIGAAFVALPVFRFSAFPLAVCRLHLHLAQISTRGKANYWIFIFPISPLTAYVEIFLLHFCFAPPHCHFPFALVTLLQLWQIYEFVSPTRTSA